MDNHDSCKFNESLDSNNTNMLCPLHFLVNLPQKWGGDAGRSGGTRKKNFLASLAQICRPLHFQRAICGHGTQERYFSMKVHDCIVFAMPAAVARSFESNCESSSLTRQWS